MQMFYQLTNLDSAFKKLLSSEELCYCLIAGLGHDLNHPGTNNSFEIKIGSSRALEA